MRLRFPLLLVIAAFVQASAQELPAVGALKPSNDWQWTILAFLGFGLLGWRLFLDRLDRKKDPPAPPAAPLADAHASAEATGHLEILLRLERLAEVPERLRALEDLVRGELSAVHARVDELYRMGNIVEPNRRKVG